MPPSPTPFTVRGRLKRTRSTIVTAMFMLAGASLVVGCSDDTPQVSIEDHLEAIAGRQLTPAEVERQLQVASTMCGMDLTLLTEIWGRLSERDMTFQDFVFGTECPDRSVDYALATGRALNASAESALEQKPPESTSLTLRLPSRSTTTTRPGSTTSTTSAAGLIKPPQSPTSARSTSSASTITAPPKAP